MLEKQASSPRPECCSYCENQAQQHCDEANEQHHFSLLKHYVLAFIYSVEVLIERHMKQPSLLSSSLWRLACFTCMTRAHASCGYRALRELSV
jgi:hypothetical protein